MHIAKPSIQRLFIIGIALCFSVFFSSLLGASQSYATEAINAQKYGPRVFPASEKMTAIVAAYEPEINAIDTAFAAMEDAKIEDVITIRGVKYQLGTYKGEKVVIFTTGISVPNAAMTMQMALDYFPIERVVMMGIAGAINPEFSVGDIAIPERWYFHDESVYVNPKPDTESAQEYVLPQYYEDALARYKEREKRDPHAPKYTNFGYLFPEEMSVVKQGWDKPQQMPYFSVSDNLLSLAKKAVSNVGAINMPSGKQIKVRVGGNGVTGSVFADNAQYRLWLQEVYSAQVTEMESAAVGQVCFVNEVDWIIIRSVSDLAGAQHGKNDESVFDGIASGTGTKFLIAMLDEIVKAKSE
jgi:adenosylhomocysteine nucleosidase